jgi:hypothetical protein
MADPPPRIVSAVDPSSSAALRPKLAVTIETSPFFPAMTPVSFLAKQSGACAFFSVSEANFQPLKSRIAA